MKMRSRDVQLLLTGLLVFSAGVGLVYSGWLSNSHIATGDELNYTIDATNVNVAKIPDTTPNPATATNNVPNTPSNNQNVSSVHSEKAPRALSTQEVLAMSAPFVASRSVNRLVELLAGLPLENVVEVASSLVREKASGLSIEDKVEFLMGLAHELHDESDREKILDLLVTGELLKGDKNSSLMAVARGEFAPAVQDLVTWIGKLPASDPKRLVAQAALRNALEYAARQGEIAVLKAFKQYGVALSKDEATQLLYAMARDAQGTADTVVALVKDFGANPNYESPEKITTLIAAIKANKSAAVDFVRGLIAAEVNTTQMTSDKSNVPLQAAQGKTEIDALLRSAGK